MLGWHPYWPPSAIEGHTDVPGWETALSLLNAPMTGEVDELTALSELVSTHMQGAWSIDWLWVRDRGWFLTDMAVASESFCWSDYPSAPKALPVR